MVPATSSSPHCIHKGTIVHELLHALGFWHEQSRPDRDDYITLALENVRADLAYNFDKYTLNDVDLLGTAYDYESIMHYEWDAFSINGKATIIPKKAGVELLNAKYKTLSPIDIQEIKAYYS
jgi:Notch-like protein